MKNTVKGNHRFLQRGRITSLTTISYFFFGFVSILISTHAGATPPSHPATPRSPLSARTQGVLFQTDPTPLITRDVIELTLERSQHGLALIDFRRNRFEKAKPIPRFRGRYAIRLLQHNTTLDIVRFSFPLEDFGGEKTDPNRSLNRAIRDGVRSRIRVKIPWTEQVDRLEIEDSITQIKICIATTKPIPNFPQTLLRCPPPAPSPAHK